MVKIFLDISCDLEYNIYILNIINSKESNLETTLTAFVVFALCLVGCGMQCWYLGRRVGIQHAVDYLVDSGHLDVEDEVNI